MKQILWGLLLNLVIVFPAICQNLKVGGIVTDQTGEPLPGVNIVIEGTFNGTTTDFDGNYTIEVTGTDVTLIYSFIGMNSVKEKVNGREVINVSLGADSEVLNDVIVVAYGTTTKEAFTGAAEVIGAETLESRPVTSFEKALQGTTAGLQVSSSSGQPGATASVRIRGIGSFSGSSPLYVIDGVPMSGGLSDINPNDIESLTVLKDAAASSLYGSRAANGVIIITTKQGEQGKTKISFDAQYGISSRISDGYELMNSSDFYQQSWRGVYNRELIAGETSENASQTASDDVADYVGFNPFYQDNPFDANGNLLPGAETHIDVDWRDEVYKTGKIENYNLTVSGGYKDTKVYFSLGYYKDSGTVLSSDFTRYSAKVNVTHKVNDFITAGMSNTLTYSKSHSQPSGSGGANPVRSAEMINAASPVYNADGSFNWENKSVYDFNPVGLAKLDKYESIYKRALVNVYLNFQILPNLSFRTTGAVDYTDGYGMNYYNPYHGNGAGVNGRTSESTSYNTALNITNILSWNKATENSTFEAIIGQEAYTSEAYSLSAGVTDFAVPNHPELSWGAQPTSPSSGTSEWSMISYLGQFKYNYGGKYYLSASLRTDGSSRFGEDNKYGVFYSVGGSWRLTKEEWIPQISWLNNLKLRASFGTSGNSAIGNYASLALYGSGANYGGYPGLTPVQLSNPDLQWEKIESFNLGMETRVFNRLSGSLEYYRRDSDALLYALPLSKGKGFSSVLTNFGAMRNTGFEMTMDLDVMNKNDFYWNMGFNISTNENEITELGVTRTLSGTKMREVGGDFYQFFMREWAGVNPQNGAPMWYTNVASDDKVNNTESPSSFDDPNGSGRMVTSEYSDAERVRSGSASPDFYGGFNNSIGYKSFDLSFYFYYSIGGSIYNYDYAANMHDGSKPSDNLSVDALKAWTPNNKHTNVPRYVTNNTDNGQQMSTRFLEDASYVRLKNVSIAYNLPESFCNRFKINNFKLFVSGENLWTLTDYKGFDPEGSLSGTTSNNIPGVKTYTFGLKMDL